MAAACTSASEASHLNEVSKRGRSGSPDAVTARADTEAKRALRIGKRETNFFKNLPTEVVERVFSFLEVPDIRFAATTCKYFASEAAPQLAKVCPIAPELIRPMGGIQGFEMIPQINITIPAGTSDSANEHIESKISSIYMMQKMTHILQEMESKLRTHLSKSSLSAYVLSKRGEYEQFAIEAEEAHFPENERLATLFRTLIDPDPMMLDHCTSAFLDTAKEIYTRYQSDLKDIPPLFKASPFIRGTYSRGKNMFFYVGFALTSTLTFTPASLSDLPSQSTKKELLLFSFQNKRPYAITISSSSNRLQHFFINADDPEYFKAYCALLEELLEKEELSEDSIPPNQLADTEQLTITPLWS